MSPIELIVDESAADSFYSQIFENNSPISLKKDYKNLFGKDYPSIVESWIIRNLYLVITKSPNSLIKLQGIKLTDHKTFITKVRLPDHSSKSGKSGGYRCLVLIDFINNRAILLHIYKKKGRSQKDDITPEEKKALSKVHQVYRQSL
jgi:mRNA-degrading endonuclease RelE of RelBE toxin-antitoxin system